MAEAELRRRDPDGLSVPWTLNADGTDPVADEITRGRLLELLGWLDANLTGLSGINDSQLARLTNIEGLLGSTLTVTGELTLEQDQPLTDSQLRFAPVDVAGTVDVGNLPATFPDQHSQPLTDTQLRFAPVDVDTGLVQPVTPGDSVDVGNLPAVYPDGHSQPLTDTQLRATRVPVDPGDVATEPTLEAIRLLTVEVRDLATTIRDEQLRRTDTVTLADGTTVEVTSDALAAHAQGMFFVGGARRNVGGSLSSDRYVAQIINPSTSGRICYVVAVVLYSSTTQWFRWSNDVTLDSPTQGEPARSLNVASPAVSTMELWTDTSAPDEGDWWDAETRITANAPVPIQFATPIPLAPGQHFVAAGDSSSSQETCANVYFYEEPV